MNRLLTLFISALAITAQAEVITMDLQTATDMAANPVVYSTSFGSGYYDCTDVWDSTYNDSELCQYIYTNDARFSLSHLPSRASYGGMSWEGFTLSRVSQDTANVFGCVANGGVAGVGSPYVIGYFSDYVTESQGYSSNIILFDQAYYPEYIYICQNSNTWEAIKNGGVFSARQFTKQDTLALIISGLNSDKQETRSITYYLAVDGEMNSGWVQVPLTALGKTEGLSFRMTTTDMGDFGANTPMYFALDGLTVNTNPTTDLPTTESNSDREGRVLMVDAQLMILHNGQRYSIMGQRMQ